MASFVGIGHIWTLYCFSEIIQKIDGNEWTGEKQDYRIQSKNNLNIFTFINSLQQETCLKKFIYNMTTPCIDNAVMQ